MSYLSHNERLAHRHAARRARARRRRAMLGALLAAPVIAALIASGLAVSSASRPTQRAAAASSSLSATWPSGPPVAARKASPFVITPARPGIAHVIMAGARRREIALTFDDGLCAACVARIIHTLAKTGTHATIFPNGRYWAAWNPVAPIVRRLGRAGQLTIGNHTFLHHDARLESPAAFEADLTNAELWIERTFDVSARPFFRPPYGAYNSETLVIAGRLGYTKVIIWNGTVADSSPRSVGYILDAIRYWARPGAIILMHGNYPATSIALPQILSILHERSLRPVTLAQLLR